MKKRILISVTDKAGLEKFKRLTDTGEWEIISTGGTLTKLKEFGIPCISIESVTGFPEMMGGRLKTLDPKIFGGILADRSNESHMKDLEKHSICPIDMVVVNLYDFEGNPDIEQIDIGGPSLLRAAAKNGLYVVPLLDPDKYDFVIEQIEQSGDVDIQTRKDLVVEVFDHTSKYDYNIWDWMYDQDSDNQAFLSPKINSH